MTSLTKPENKNNFQANSYRSAFSDTQSTATKTRRQSQSLKLKYVDHFYESQSLIERQIIYWLLLTIPDSSTK